uniref:E3 ubiquitin-protein ligase n=1 Tax=Pectinophora gossypiella TaxID=13191 RepID=A0A1E1WES9_PECGO
MASAKANKKASAMAVELPECPVCMETMSKPIYQCASGHSLCNVCTTNLCPPNCPICRQPMTQMRNWQLEELIAKAKVPCPNKPSGCVYTMTADDLESHLKECIFRHMDCPLGAIFGRCSWNGKLGDMVNHFKERHADNFIANPDADIELSNVNIREDDRHMYLLNQGKLLFILTMKIDTSQKMAYWTVQHIGSKNMARQYIYEVCVTSKQDPRRKVVFIEHCFNDAIKADEVFRQAKCALLPLDSLNHFIANKKMSFKFLVRRLAASAPKNKTDAAVADGQNENKFNNGPPKQGSKGAGAKFVPNKGPRQKNFNKNK